MRNFPIISELAEDTLSESSVLPMRGIKKGRKDLGEILSLFFFLPSPADQPQCFLFLSRLSSSTTYFAASRSRDFF